MTQEKHDAAKRIISHSLVSIVRYAPPRTEIEVHIQTWWNVHGLRDMLNSAGFSMMRSNGSIVVTPKRASEFIAVLDAVNTANRIARG